MAQVVKILSMWDKNLLILHGQYHGADVLATQGARASAIMIMTILNELIGFSRVKG